MKINQISPKTAREHMFNSHIYSVRVDHTNNTMYYIPIRSMSASDIEKAEKDVNNFFIEIDWKGDYDYEKTTHHTTKPELGPWECEHQLSFNKNGNMDIPR